MIKWGAPDWPYPKKADLSTGPGPGAAPDLPIGVVLG